MIYPTPEQIIEYNFLALELIKVKKADQPKVLSRTKILDQQRNQGVAQPWKNQTLQKITKNTKSSSKNYNTSKNSSKDTKKSSKQ